MKKTIQVFVYKKNLDLDCLSAAEAIKQFMKKDKCESLRRFLSWELDVESELSDEQIITNLTESSYLLLNPNKEGYYLNAVPNRSEKSVLVQAKHKLKSEHADIAASLTKKTGLNISRLEKSIIWDCTININDKNEATQYTEEHLLNTDSYSQGILINPIYETYTILK